MELGAKDNSGPLLLTSSAFMKWIQQETISKKFIMPTLAAYDGTRNPREHVLDYKTFMELHTHPNALMCKVFPTTLTGPAQAWFNSLESGSVRNFVDLANMFINSFIAGVTERKMSYLETIRQRRNESLREYVARFNAEALQISELDEARAVEAMQKGMTSPEFFGSLYRKLHTTLSELIKRAEKYIRQDDALNTSQFNRDDKEKGRDVDDRRQDRLKRTQDRGLEALNKHR
ncbi:uncharacterized protein LOC110627617 [Manihot esculenta]|uniref:uncharacterized protein LOC110627617 n=1 Tax=Manihot esculenta TaxID=3983 RepID=UPI000B5D74C1|nr:uncharacterized protein LOC110627617 [Manihot esculenta]